MTPDLLIPEVHEALRGAVAARAAEASATPAPNRLPASPEQHRKSVRHEGRRRRRWPHGLPLLLGGVLVAGSGVAATTGWNPFAGRPHAPEALRGSAPADVIASLSVMRRPQREQDRTAIVTAGLGRTSSSQGRGVYVDAVRVIGKISFTVAMTQASPDSPPVNHDVPSTVIVYPRTRAASRTGYVPDQGDDSTPICMSSIRDVWANGAIRPPWLHDIPRPTSLDERVEAGGTCTSIHQIRMKGLWMGGSFSMGDLLGLLPDGVTAVRAETSDGQTITARVRDNTVRLIAPGPTHRFHQGSLRWLDASGHVIRRF